LFVFNCSGIGHRDRHVLCDLRDVLYCRDSLYRNCDFATDLCFASFILTFVSAAIRPGLRCVGELHATGILADLVIGAACPASTDKFIESAAGTAFVSRRIKQAPARRISSTDHAVAKAPRQNSAF
jgi:hypothetical protein